MAQKARKRARWGGAEGTKRTLHMMEGLCQRLNEQPTHARPSAVTHVWLATQFGVSPATMRNRLADATSRRARSDDADLYCELWSKISGLLAEKVSGTIWTIATDPGNTKAFDAAKWVLERTAKESYDLEEARENHDRGSAVADIPQEVWDEMSDVEEEQLAEIEMNMHGEMLKLERLVRRIQRRCAEKRSLQADAEDDEE